MTLYKIIDENGAVLFESFSIRKISGEMLVTENRVYEIIKNKECIDGLRITKERQTRPKYNKKILLKNIKTNEEIICDTYEQAAKIVGCCTGYITHLIFCNKTTKKGYTAWLINNPSKINNGGNSTSLDKKVKAMVKHGYASYGKFMVALSKGEVKI